MIRKIVVPLDVDVEESAAEALTLARELAEAHGAKLVLLHVVEQVPTYAMANLPPEFRGRASKVAKEALQAVAAQHGLDGKAELAVREGRPSTEILAYAGAAGVDMIVLGSHDPGATDYLLGSVAARVVRHAHCSVLVVRHPKA